MGGIGCLNCRFSQDVAAFRLLVLGRRKAGFGACGVHWQARPVSGAETGIRRSGRLGVAEESFDFG